MLSSKRRAIRADIAYDVIKAAKVDFDALLRLFLSRCLSGDVKKEFEEKQTLIEKQRRERYDYTSRRKATWDTLQDTQSKVDADREGAGPVFIEETKVIAERDKILGDILHHCLKTVTDIANDQHIQALLGAFAASIQNTKTEAARYLSYTMLYKGATDELNKLHTLPLRSSGDQHLRLSSSSPRIIPSTFFGTGEIAGRKPDLVPTSVSAAKSSSADLEASLEGHSRGDENCKFKPEAGGSVEATSTTINARPKRSRSEYDDHTDASNKKHKLEAITVSSTGTTRPAPPPDRSTLENESATYAKELLSYSPSAAHVINTLIVDEVLYVWYYDRQGIIRSAGISITTDFTRFLVLLLAFQRFTVEDSGFAPPLNLEALVRLGIKEHPVLDARKGLFPPIQDINILLEGEHFSTRPRVTSNMTSLEGPLVIKPRGYLSHQPHCVTGRATSVSMAVQDEKALGTKLSSPGVQGPHEANSSGIDRAICEEKKPSMPDSQAGIIPCAQSIMYLPGKRHRALQMTVLEELVPLTSQSGTPFVDAWLDAVICHAFLWKHGIEHSEPSLWNLMYHTARKWGVLTDFDLSATVLPVTRVLGTDRAGIVPFMALDLLHDEYWEGKISRHYHHELEAFIWMLPFVFLAYDNGKSQPKTPFIEAWLTSDHNACRKEKYDFVITGLRTAKALVKSGFKGYRTLMVNACIMVRVQYAECQYQALALDDSDRPAHPKDGNISPLAPHIEQSAAMWDKFMSVLSKSDIDITRLQKYRPVPDTAQR